MSRKKPVYRKSFARDYCLPLIEIWSNAETIDPRQWTYKPRPISPYLLFEHTQETVIQYIDHAGVRWVKEEMGSLIKQDSHFVLCVVKEFNIRAKKIQTIWHSRRTLSKMELQNFTSGLRDLWVWFEPVWWLMEMLPPKSRQFRLVHKARFENEKIGEGSDRVIRNSLHALFPSLGIYSTFLLLQEIFLNNIPPLTQLKKRSRGYFYAQGSLFVGATIKDIEKEFGIIIEQSRIPHHKRIVRGQIAYEGVAQGVVRRVMSHLKIPPFLNSEILVTSMTTPDFLPAMKRAAAIVTDEGGITCHAAIVARELKKPCVIGTKIATHVFKDGDLVEVDATHGIVRKI